MKQQKLQGIQIIIGKIAGTLLLLVLFSMLSCTADQDQQEEKSYPVEFELTQTRATDAMFEDGDKIGIYAVAAGKTFVESGNYADNRQYSYKAGKFLPVSTSEQIYVVTGKSYTYYAYYPYRSGINPSNVEFNAIDITTKNRPLWSMYNTNAGNIVRLPFENIFGLVEVNINETADKIISGVMLNKLPKASVNLCRVQVDIPSSQSPVSVPLTFYSSQNSISTFRTLLPAGNDITSGDELFNFVTSSSKTKKYYATESTSIVAGVKNSFNLTLLEDYIIKAISSVGGSITDATAWASGKTFQDGQSCSLYFTADNGYYFDGVYENGLNQNCISSPYTFTVTGNRTLEVRFKSNVITYGDWTVSVSANPTTIVAGGGTSMITASATRDILTNGVKTGTDTANPTLSVSGTGFSLSNKILTASNNTGSSRSCTVRATYSGVSKTCTVTQSAANITYGNWVVSVSASPATIAAGGGTSTITASAVRDVFTNGVKTGTDTANPSLSISGTGFSLSSTTVTAYENTGSLRQCTVTATYAGISKACTITQKPAQITWQYNLSVSPTFLSFSSKGQGKSFTVTSTRTKIVNGTITGTVENTAYSTSISGANASAFSVSGMTVTASENPTTDFRDGTLTITQTASGGKSATITLEQEGKVDIGTEI